MYSIYLMYFLNSIRFDLSNVLCEQHQIWLNKSFNSNYQRSIKKVSQIQTKLLLLRTILIVKKLYVNQIKLNTFSEFISNHTHTFRELLPSNSKHIFRVHIKHCFFGRVTPKQYYTVFQTSSNTNIFREFLANNTTLFSGAYIKQD